MHFMEVLLDHNTNADKTKDFQLGFLQTQALSDVSRVALNMAIDRSYLIVVFLQSDSAHRLVANRFTSLATWDRMPAIRQWIA